MSVTFEKLERAFYNVLVRNRAGLTGIQCPPEAYTAHAFFAVGDDKPRGGISLVPTILPFESLWIVTNHKGLGIVAYVERDLAIGVRPDYLWYPQELSGVRIKLTESEIDAEVSFVIDSALRELLTSNLHEVASKAQSAINANRAKEGLLPPLPRFIRVRSSGLEAPVIDPGEQVITIDGPDAKVSGTSPQGHQRRGHWRTYRASGKRVWINEMAINGGSTTPRNYRIVN